jgi:hypothetical protein
MGRTQDEDVQEQSAEEDIWAYTGGKKTLCWMKLHNDELHDLYYFENLTRVT